MIIFTAHYSILTEMCLNNNDLRPLLEDVLVELMLLIYFIDSVYGLCVCVYV